MSRSFRYELYLDRMKQHPTAEQFVEGMAVADVELFLADVEAIEAEKQEKDGSVEEAYKKRIAQLEAYLSLYEEIKEKFRKQIQEAQKLQEKTKQVGDDVQRDEE
jgi:hypothetical protein